MRRTGVQGYRASIWECVSGAVAWLELYRLHDSVSTFWGCRIEKGVGCVSAGVRMDVGAAVEAAGYGWWV